MSDTEKSPGAKDLRMDRACLMEEQGMEIASRGHVASSWRNLIEAKTQLCTRGGSDGGA